MRVRIKFAKTGALKFVGHLDFMRYFQKLLTKSGLPVIYSRGFNPHMMITFAAPLGLGEETIGDYADVDLAYRDPAELSNNEKYMLRDYGLVNEDLPAAPPKAALLDALNQAAVPNVRLLDACRVGMLKSDNVMARVRYASWEITLEDGFMQDVFLAKAVNDFWEQDQILFHKVTKKKEADIDIKPLIVTMSAACDAAPGNAVARAHGFGRKIFLKCAAGSIQNIKPSAVLEALCSFAGCPYDPYGFHLLRTDLYDEELVALSDTGSAI